MTEAIFERITIIGLGLIGSSIARSAREYHLADIIIGCDQNEVSLNYARANKFIDVALSDAKTAVNTSQLIILATPPSTLEQLAESIAPSLKPGMIVMDVASIKQAAIEAIAPHIPKGVEFIPAHPIAGSEQSGVAAGRADLFKQKLVVITPVELKQNQTLQNITNFWKGMGAQVEGMPPHLHDLIYGYVSHLPQLLAYGAHKVLGEHTNAPQLKTFLRIAHSNPALWTDIFSLNQDNILRGLDRYLDAIAHVARELQQAPADEQSKSDAALAYHTLFPRLAASCLITTVMETEKQSGFSFARYAGTGFADFTSPATTAPDSDIENISGHHQAVATILSRYAEELRRLRNNLAANAPLNIAK